MSGRVSSGAKPKKTGLPRVPAVVAVHVGRQVVGADALHGREALLVRWMRGREHTVRRAEHAGKVHAVAHAVVNEAAVIDPAVHGGPAPAGLVRRVRLDPARPGVATALRRQPLRAVPGRCLVEPVHAGGPAPGRRRGPEVGAHG